MNKIKYAPAIFLICLLASWIFSMAKCEFITSKHIKEFKVPDEVIVWSGELDNMKLLDYSLASASLYYYDTEIGFEIKYVKQNGFWEMETWRCVWSKSGNADEFVWPYLHHSAEGIGLCLLIGMPTAFVALFFLLLQHKGTSEADLAEDGTLPGEDRGGDEGRNS